MSVAIDGPLADPFPSVTELGRGTGHRLCATWAAAGLADEYVVYEAPAGLVFAGGVRARIRLTATDVTVSVEGDADTRTYRGAPAAALAAALARLPFHRWRVYGWTAFEFTSHLSAGLRSGVLAELVVPEFEIHVAADGTVDRTGVPAGVLERLAAIAPIAPIDTVSCPVDVRRSGDDGYRARVAAAIAEIRAGAYEKVILSRRLPVPFPVDVPASYALGRDSNTPARSFLLRLSGLEAAGFSPEIVGAVHADGTVETQPLAGTRALHMDGTDPQALRAELLSDAKEIVEHALSVQLSCAEVDAIAVPSTRMVSEFMTVRERGSVQHLASTVIGKLATGVSAWEALDVLFPAVTASGIPKAPAVDAIARLEPHPRGPYAGAVVTASSNGELDAALVLRSLFSTEDGAWLQAGAGVIAQSDPQREFEETCEKLASVAPYLVRRAAR
ncbi:Salicylate synthase OS=Tsukamurella paurometabola (strain ATCC 8368 / DSM / CCUG 35730 / CIP 100753 / JCM 10117 / KCTC 9821 / NBRC 16120 / NCIMB 702349/ NCTC 13040) OX=521096 GN=Tpau_4330 PE=4 SV=1 [Tsukamurella paurometabola]|uniref:Salicylate synthase n=1 Tax=Tsukamurella paurometabola (strain ATCC 8368 / DSM 20162 / CCUG 35730 / CIP 100753 / JCM 10117 / KCTC 9821 / NBRC 16120 / NCIMB 702349 / NCTC 13040) TaxID=521096 RepID=D5UZ44_TSUPD|nr:salicylate synthase [Tsukamurella paurometabola]ADG80891.1 salicylate synthase [Tsukamurella paurometabola DSM 20162]SUQ39257.1 Isochorismate synthase/isochorismate-pyruvate lyase mbtI [Tsukamurella paurometabola]